MPTSLIILWFATAVVFYTLIGYPMILAFYRRRKAPAVEKQTGFRTSVTAIMAVHNGAVFIRAKLESLLALNYPRHLLDIIVVSDGCTDQTEAIVRDFEAQRVRLLRMPQRSGKAAALNLALENASGEILFFTDVRQPLDADALGHLVENFADPTIGAVTGELRLLRGDTGEQADMDLYWRYEVWARRRHGEIDSLFNTTGCIYAVRRGLVQPIPPDTLTDDSLIPLRIFFQGYRIVFDPQSIAYDYPALSGTEFRRRMRTLAGLWQVYLRLPALATGRNRMRFHFFSHKFLRLIMPWAIVVIFLATAALPASSFRTLLLTNEVALILLSLLDLIIPPGLALKRLSSPARTFVVMNLAALASTAVFFVSANRLWIQTRVNSTEVKASR